MTPANTALLKNAQSDTPVEAKIKIGDQWFYRGNVSPSWFYLASRLDGSASGIAEKVDVNAWNYLERIVALERDRAELLMLLKAMVVSERCARDPLNPCWDNRPTDVPGKHWGGGDACVPCKARAAIAKARS